MEKYYDAKSIEQVLSILKNLAYNIRTEGSVCINVEIITTDGISNMIKMSNEKEHEIEINRNIIVYDKKAISLKDIVKLKIGINSDKKEKEIKKLLNKELRNISIHNSKNTPVRGQGLSNKYKNYNDDIENYIQKNSTQIYSINYNGFNNEDRSEERNVEKSVEKIYIPKEYTIDEVVTGIETTKLEGVLSRVEEDKNIIGTKKIEILGIEPVNKWVDVKELNGKVLRVDPTRENYIGVVLEDGTFEPLKIELKSFTILQDETLNYIGNINANNQINPAIKNVDEFKENIFKDIDEEPIENNIEDKSENNIEDENIKKDENIIKEEIKGNIEYVGGGILVIENDNSEIIVYSTDKIISVN